MKVLYVFVTTESAEPLATAQFIAGYELSGLTWDGTITVLENTVINASLQSTLQTYINQGYELAITNTAPSSVSEDTHAFMKENGMLLVNPAGANNYQFEIQSSYYRTRMAAVLVGSGLEGVGNATGHPCMFYGTNPAENDGKEIVDIRQCGTVYNVSKIRRHSASVIAVKLEGVTNVNEIGLIGNAVNLGYGIPITFDNVSGTDISPLPDGDLHCSYITDGSDWFFINWDTTSGTINTGFDDDDYQTVTGGTMTYGDTDSSKVLVVIDGYGTFDGLGTTIQGVTGFSNDVDGMYAIDYWDTTDGFGNKLKYVMDLGTGEYEGGAKWYYITQSYSTPYVAGKLAGIKDKLNQTLNVSWSEVIGRAITTASNEGTYDTYDGYGVVDVDKASDRLITIGDLGTPVLSLLSVSTPTPDYRNIFLEWTIIPYAEEYQLYYRGALIATTVSHIVTESYIIERGVKGDLNNFKVRAVNSTQTGEFSNVIEYPFYYYPAILVSDDDEA